MKYILLLSFCAGIVLSSCNQQVKNERLKRIDSLETYIPAVEAILDQIDSAQIELQLNQISQTEDWLLDNVDDTIPKKPGMIVADYFRVAKYLGQSLGRYKSVQIEVAYTKKQIQSLREDVINSFYSDEEFEGYFSTEADAVAKLNDAAGELATKHESISEEHKKLQMASTQVMDSIKAVIYSDQPL